MEYIISEVQIACIVLMALMTFILVFSLPRYSITDPVLENARKILSVGTILLTVHFIVQYYLQKSEIVSPEIRTIFNLLFGFPISFCFNISLLYLQRKGHICKREYVFFAVAYICLIAACITIFIIGRTSMDYVHLVSIIMSLIYASSLIFANILQLKEYKRIIRQKDNSLELLTKRTKWCMFLMAIMGIGLPVMTFNTNLFMRSVYGIFAISIAFLYIFSFIGYDLSQKEVKHVLQKSKVKENADDDVITDKPLLDDVKLQEVSDAIDEYVKSRSFMKSGITIKDVASQMGLTRNVLNAYFQTTTYKKFNSWLTFIRIEEAKKLMLEHTDWSNEAVAEECGFSNRAYFQRQFSEHEGISPTKWIKEHRNDQKDQGSDEAAN